MVVQSSKQTTRIVYFMLTKEYFLLHKNAIKPSPLLVTGMHRSGTTLVSKLLQQLNCFMGFRREPNEESTFFRRLNDSMLLRHGALWNDPTPFKQLLETPQELLLLSQQMRQKIHHLPALEYWGPLLHAGIERKYSYWGWKDPRTSIVLPVWLEVFPDATVIQVVRNGVDVAASLRTRDMRMRQENRRNLPSDYPSLMENFQLWCDYMNFSEAAEKNWQGSYFTIRYESLVESPDEVIQNLCSHLGLLFPANVSRLVNKTRKHAFLDDPELFQLYQHVKDHPYMVKYDYYNVTV